MFELLGQLIKLPSKRPAICIEVHTEGVSVRYLDDGSWTYVPFGIIL